MPILSPSRQLKKELSLFGVFTIATGATLSSGFFLLPGLAAEIAGSGVILAYLIAVVPLLPGILSKIELATAMPRAGGEYYFVDRALGPLMGTIGGLGTWCSLLLKTAFALVGIGAYLDLYWPWAWNPMKLVAVLMALLFGGLNILGARKATLLQTVLVIGLLALLIWFGFAGVAHAKPHPLRDVFDKGWHSIMTAAGLVCISYMGLTKVASVAEEVRNPERNLTLGIFLALGTAIVIYAVGTYVLIGVLPHTPADEGGLYGDKTAVAHAANAFAGNAGKIVMTVAAILAFLSVSNAGILSASRYPLAMARDHLLPTWLRQLNSRRSPRNAVIATVIAIAVFVLIFDPTEIAELASAFLLLLFALNCLAVIVMRESRIDSYDPGFRSPLYPWTQILGIVMPGIVIVMMGWLPILFTTLLILVGALWYRHYARLRVIRDGAIYHLFARLGQRRFEGLDRELRSILKEKGLRQDDPYDNVVALAAVIDVEESISFEELAEAAGKRLAADLPVTADRITEGFLQGTRVGATPVSKGVALPHIRLPEIEQPLLALARVPAGVRMHPEVEMVDPAYEQPFAAVFFLISPEDDAAQHLRILAQLARHVDDETFMIDWLAAETEQQLKEVLLREERFLALTVDIASATGHMIGRALSQIELPEDSLVAMIHREGRMVVPRGNTVLQQSDRVTVIGQPQGIRRLAARYGVTSFSSQPEPPAPGAATARTDA